MSSSTMGSNQNGGDSFWFRTGSGGYAIDNTHCRFGWYYPTSSSTGVSVWRWIFKLDFSKAEKEQTANLEDVLAISERLMKQNMEAYEVLAK